MINKSKFPKIGAKESKCCSTVMCLSWVLIGMWVAFLVYCWQSGLVDQKRISQIVSEVDTAIESTEASLRKRIDTLKVPSSDSGTHSDPEAHESQSSPETSNEDPEMHIVFSTDCGGYQDWQTLLLFHSAKVVGQTGKISRIASGCSEQRQKELVALYKHLYPDFGVHFTPDFKNDAKTNKKCKF
jgi:hypothetical protein